MIMLGLMATAEAKKKATGKRKRQQPKEQYCHKIMPDGFNKPTYTNLDKEACKDANRVRGQGNNKKSCTCKCLPGWKKGKITGPDGLKVVLCNQPNFGIERKVRFVQTIDSIDGLAEKKEETMNTPNDRVCTFVKDDLVLDCDNTLYDTKTIRKIIPPSTLTRLSMENNHIDSLVRQDVRDTYQGLSGLVEVSFKNNFIKKLEHKGVFKASHNLEYVDFSFNQIAELSHIGIFKRNGKIKTLKLNNNMLKVMKKKFTKNLKQLEHLELQNNRIGKITGLVLQSSPNLRYADFSFNKIEHISSKSFSNQAMMTTLLLNNNGIKSINRKLFAKMQKLQELDLSYNRIGFVDEETEFKNTGKNKNPAFLHDAFKGLTSLQKLNLAHNEIAEIHEQQFAKMEKLVLVNLDHNLLEEIPETAFDGCPELKYVFIRNNLIKSLPGNLFNENPALKIAFLSHNDVDTIEDGLLADKPELKRVDLGDNSFDQVGDIFEGSQQKLEHAYFYQNKIDNVNDNVLDAAPALRSIDVADNQLQDHKLGFIPKAIDGATDNNLNSINLVGNNLQNAQLNNKFAAASFDKLKDLIAKAKADYAAAQAENNL